MRKTPLLALFLVVACTQLPPDDEPPAMSASDRQLEQEISAQAQQQIVGELRLYPEGPVTTYVRQVGARIAAASDRDEIPYSFQVVDEDVLNAFTIGDGKVFVYTGLLKSLQNEAQLASVLAHEVAHVARWHTVVTAKKAMETQSLVGLAGAIIGEGELVQVAQSVAAQILTSGFSRDQEDQADRVGIDFLYGGRYDVRQYPEVFEIFRRIGGETKGSMFNDLFASHSSNEERIALARSIIAEEYAGRFDGLEVGAQAYQRMLAYLR